MRMLLAGLVLLLPLVATGQTIKLEGPHTLETRTTDSVVVENNTNATVTIKDRHGREVAVSSEKKFSFPIGPFAEEDVKVLYYEAEYLETSGTTLTGTFLNPSFSSTVAITGKDRAADFYAETVGIPWNIYAELPAQKAGFNSSPIVTVDLPTYFDVIATAGNTRDSITIPFTAEDIQHDYPIKVQADPGQGALRQIGSFSPRSGLSKVIESFTQTWTAVGQYLMNAWFEDSSPERLVTKAGRYPTAHGVNLSVTPVTATGRRREFDVDLRSTSGGISLPVWIHWGDGSSQSLQQNGGLYKRLWHDYANPGNFQVRIVVSFHDREVTAWSHDLRID